MITKTNFYSSIFDRFETPYSNGKIYVYVTGTSNLVTTYKDNINLIENTNPIILDKNGNCSIFLDQDLTVDFYIEDSEGNHQVTFTGIRQLMGADGGEPEPFDPSEEELEKFRGRQGIQGPSKIGDPGIDGVQGDQGYPFSSKVVILNNQEAVIPAGVTEFFITATGGGGSGASYSKYTYIYDVLSKNQGLADQNQIKLSYKLTEDQESFNQSKNYVTQKQRDFVGLYLLPGSGSAGESRYRYKVTISDPSVSHKVLVYVGSAGKYKDGDLNGQDGTSTKVYLDNKLVLEVAGGLGGQQQLPDGDQDIPDFDAAGYIRLNRGHRNGLAYMKLTNPDAPQFGYREDTSGNSNTVKNRYRKKFNTIYEWKELWIQVYYRRLEATIDLKRSFLTNDLKNLNGQDSIFDNYYLRYPQKNELSSPSGQDQYNSTKTVNREIGKGSGGDSYLTINKTDYDGTGYYTPQFYNSGLGSYTFFLYNKNELIANAQSLINNFETSDDQTYLKGLETTYLNTDPFFDSIGVMGDSLDARAKSQSRTIVYASSGFYALDFFEVMPYKKLSTCYGSDGTDGYCYIEYGSITEHLSSEAITTS